MGGAAPRQYFLIACFVATLGLHHELLIHLHEFAIGREQHHFLFFPGGPNWICEKRQKISSAIGSFLIHGWFILKTPQSGYVKSYQKFPFVEIDPVVGQVFLRNNPLSRAENNLEGVPARCHFISQGKARLQFKSGIVMITELLDEIEKHAPRFGHFYPTRQGNTDHIIFIERIHRIEMRETGRELERNL
jgi:hypothetical protein